VFSAQNSGYDLKSHVELRVMSPENFENLQLTLAFLELVISLRYLYIDPYMLLFPERGFGKL